MRCWNASLTGEHELEQTCGDGGGHYKAGMLQSLYGVANIGHDWHLNDNRRSELIVSVATTG